MQNLVETFDKFNCKRRRPDRFGHMRNCGFEYKGDFLIDPPDTPKSQGALLARTFNEFEGKPAHVVYFLGASNMDGWRGYQYWVKNLD
jgi:hypothetical protein